MVENNIALQIRKATDVKMQRTDYYKAVRHYLDDYSGMVLSPEETEKIQLHLQKLSTGSTALVPMICAGDLCSFKTRCIFWQMGKAPVTKQCISEASLLSQFIIQFMDEYNVDPESPTEVGYCNEMAEIEIMLQRLNMVLSRPENAELIIDQTMGFSNEGTPITQKQISPYIELKDKLFNRKTKIIKLMVGDRQEKYKKESALKQKSAGDSSTQMAEMRRRIEALSSKLAKVSSDTDEENKNILTPDEIIATADLDNK
jgi:hypothetical protein